MHKIVSYIVQKNKAYRSKKNKNIISKYGETSEKAEEEEGEERQHKEKMN